MKDPIVEEIRKYRMEHTRKFGGDLTGRSRVLLTIIVPWMMTTMSQQNKFQQTTIQQNTAALADIKSQSEDVEQVLEHYMLQSEQLDTRLVLAAGALAWTRYFHVPSSALSCKNASLISVAMNAPAMAMRGSLCMMRTSSGRQARVILVSLLRMKT